MSAQPPGPSPGTPASGPVEKSVLQLAWPLILSFVMRQGFTLVDAYFAALIGDEAVAAIGLSFPFEFLLVAFWVGAGNGMTALLSRAVGAREGERIRQVIRASWTLVGGIVPTFLVLGAAIWFGAPHLVATGPDDPGIPPDVVEPFRIYASVIVAGTALTGFWSILPDSIVKAHHDTKATMWAGIWSNLVNVALNCLFVLVFGWGMFGIAFSTVLGRLAGLAYAVGKARAHEARRVAAGLDTVPGTYERPVRSLLRLGVPAALTYVLMAAESGLVNLTLARQPDPTTSLAGYAVYHRIQFLFLMPVVAAAVALLPFVARRWGRHDVGGVWRGFREVAAWSVAYVVLLVTPLCTLASGPMVALFTASPETADLAARALLLCPLAILAAVPFFACRPAFEGMQQGWPGLAVAVLRYALLTLPAALAGASVAAASGRPPLVGVVAGLVAATAVSSAVFLAWMRRFLRRAESLPGS